MDLMGLKTSQSLSTRLGAKPESTSALSKSQSDLFQKKLGQISNSSSESLSPRAEKSISPKTLNPNSEKPNSPNPSNGVAKSQNKEMSPSNFQNEMPKMSQPMIKRPIDTAPEVQDSIGASWASSDPVGIVEPKADSVDSLTRRAAIQNFMQKMEAELGVDSTEIVQALTQLSPLELAAPPEQNVDKIIGFLNLNPEEQEVAKQLFDEMLAQSSAESMAEYLKATDRQLSLSVLSQNQIRQESMQKSLEQMNQKFFAPAAAPQAGASSFDQSAESAKKTDGKTALPADFWSVPPAVALASAPVAVAGATAAPAATSAGAMGLASQSGANASAQNANSSQSQMIDGMKVDGSVVNTSTGLSADLLPPMTMPSAWTGLSKVSMGRSAYGLGATGAVTTAATQNLESSTLGAELGGTDLNALSLESLGLGQETGADSQDLSSEVNEAFQEIAQKAESGDMFDVEGTEFTVKADASQAPAVNDKHTVKAPSFMISQQPTDSEQAANVKEIISQANYLVKNGGGEMKIAMNPEGLGQLNLKVAVNDGQVAIEMVTESNEVKKLLEKGLGDLKATLASHKLSVDNVRVDLSGEIAKSFDHAHDQAQRQSAQNFMEQFRQDNGSWRRNFMDIPGGRMTDVPGDRGPQDALTRIQASKPKTTQRRLDLVA